MKPVNIGGHPAYQKRVLDQLRKYFPDAASSLPSSTWEILEKFYVLDLSPIDEIMQDRYSKFGPVPRLPSDMLRSIMLSIELKITSVTAWVADMKENHLHALLSGFIVGDTPGIGTFYDFFSRLWCSDKNNLTDAKYGRTVHLTLKDNPRLFNDPPRSSKEWKLEYNARTSAERCNKREKIDYKLEDGRHRSTKMWYCRLFTIMMCQHLDAWALSKSSRLKDLFEQAA